jgi:hypothetical protein
MGTTLQRLLAPTIWGAESIKPEDHRVRGLLRWVLPATDLLFAYFGLVGFFLHVGSVAAAAGSDWQTGWSGGLALSALACFVSISFPRLWVLEIVSKISLIFHVLFYIVLQLGRIFDPEVSAFSGLIVILILTPAWRLGDLASEAFRPWLSRRFIRRKIERRQDDPEPRG